MVWPLLIVGVGLASSTLQAQTRADLVVDGITANDQCQPVVTITNQGLELVLANAERSIAVQFIKNDIPSLKWTLSPSEIGSLRRHSGSITRAFEYPIIEGDDKIFVQVDADQNVFEDDERNNSLSRLVRCLANVTAGAPDLVVSALAVDTQCQLSVTVSNQGSGPLPAFIDSRYPVTLWMTNGTEQWMYGLPADPIRAPGASTTQTFPQLVEGDRRITAIVDRDDFVFESNQRNNSTTASLSCFPKLPDPAIAGIHFDELCRPIVALANLGDAPLPAGLADVDRYLDGVKDGTIPIATIATDPASTLAPPGAVQSWTDSEARVEANRRLRYAWKFESLREKNQNTANNQREEEIPARCLPDLEVAKLELDDECDIVVTLQNLGPGALPARAFSTNRPTLRLYRSHQLLTERVLNPVDLEPLTNRSGTHTLRWGNSSIVPMKTSVALRVEVDGGGAITEANEGNNTLARTLTCRPPIRKR